ncbi:MAG: hypothetical protein R2789_15385 [Microthrixaceae bacterium]
MGAAQSRIRVGVIGAGGRMGSTVCQAVEDDPDLELVAAVDPHYRGIDLRTATGVDSGITIRADTESLAGHGAQVAVDFTEHDAGSRNLSILAEAGIHAVGGPPDSPRTTSSGSARSSRAPTP